MVLAVEEMNSDTGPWSLANESTEHAELVHLKDATDGKCFRPFAPAKQCHIPILQDDEI